MSRIVEYPRESCFLCGAQLELRPFPKSLGHHGGFHVVVDGVAHIGELCWQCYYPDGFWREVVRQVKAGARQMELF